MITGKFKRSLGPVSRSSVSLAVTPSPPRSIPRAPLPYTVLPRIVLSMAPAADTVMPASALPATMFPSPAAVPPIRLPGALLMKIPARGGVSKPLGITPTPRKSRPTMLPWIVLPLALGPQM